MRRRFRTEGIHSYVLSPLASRLSPLASRLSPLGILATLLVFVPLLLGSRPALASDWSVTYSYGQGQSLPASDLKFCNPNSSVTATKTVTVTATLTWTGTGTPPSQVLVDEAAVVSWSAEVHRPYDNSVRGEMPPNPSGSVSGSASTGLTDVITENPDQTDYKKGQSVSGTREEVHTVHAGVVVLPSVTLTASAVATSTGDETTGSAAVVLASYSAGVPDGSAHASASFDLNPGAGSDWSTDRFVYSGPAPNGTTFTEQQGGIPKIFVDLTETGMSPVDKTVTVVQYYVSALDEPDHLLLFGSRTAEGNVSSRFFSAASSVENSVSGSAPNANGLSYNEIQTTYSATGSGIIVPPTTGGGNGNGRTASYTVVLKAKVSTELP